MSRTRSEGGNSARAREIAFQVLCQVAMTDGLAEMLFDLLAERRSVGRVAARGEASPIRDDFKLFRPRTRRSAAVARGCAESRTHLRCSGRMAMLGWGRAAAREWLLALPRSRSDIPGRCGSPGASFNAHTLTWG